MHFSMKRSLRATVAISVSALMALGAFAPAEAAPSSTTISYIGTDQPSQVKPLITAFQKKYPSIKVSYKQVPFDQYDNTISQRIGTKSTTVDVFAVDQPNVAQYAAKGYLSDLSAYKSEAIASLSPAMYSVNLFRGKLWSLSITNSTQMLFYNKDMLDDAGIAYPSISPSKRITWEEIATNSKKIVSSGVADYGFLLEQVENYYQIQALVESAGGGSGVTGAARLTPDIENAGWLKALNWYQGTFKDGIQPRGVGGFDTGPMFSDGKLAYFVGGPWDVYIFSGNDINWGVAAHPYFQGGKAVTPTGSWSLGVNSASKKQDAAKAFVKFASLDSAGNLAVATGIGSIPANKVAVPKYLVNLDAVAGDKSKGVGKLLTYEVSKTAIPRPSTVGFVQLNDLMNKAFGDIRNGADVATRLNQAKKALKDAWSLFR
jgi:ABC-type glycerol-3-phosphate transport system substrate-binding protein